MLHSEKPIHAEALLRLVVGLVLWAASATLTVSLFLSMAGSRWEGRLFMAILAIAMEGTKILSWRMGGKAHLLAYALLVLSACASFGSALQTVEAARSSFLSSSQVAVKETSKYKDALSERVSIDKEINITLERLIKLPPEYTTAATKLTGTLALLRDRRSRIQGTLNDLEESSGTAYDNANLFVLMGKTLGIAPETMLLVLLLFLAVCIEAGALALTAPIKSIAPGLKEEGTAQVQEESPERRPMSYPCPIGPMDFLKAASEGADLPYLHGRDVTARKLGISSYQAKLFVRTLCADGTVVVEGKRLKLARQANQKP